MKTKYYDPSTDPPVDTRDARGGKSTTGLPDGADVPFSPKFKNGPKSVNYLAVYQAIIAGNRAVTRESLGEAEISFGLALSLVGDHADDGSEVGSYNQAELIGSTRRWLGTVSPGASHPTLQDFDWPTLILVADGSAMLPPYADVVAASCTTWDAQLFALKHIYLDLLFGELRMLQRRWEEAISSCYGRVLQCPFINAVIERPFVRLKRAQACLGYGEDLFAQERPELAYVQYARAFAYHPELIPVIFSGVAPVPYQGPTDPANVAAIRADIDSATVDPIDPSTDPRRDDLFDPAVLLCLRRCAQAMLQIKANFNYLGYREDYVPPLRFEYLLQQARYFAEHARQGERDYLNWREKAEAEHEKRRELVQHLATQSAEVKIASLRVQEAQQNVDAINAKVEALHQQWSDLDTLIQESDAQTEFNAWCGVISTVESRVEGAITAVATGGAVGPGGASGTGALLEALGSVGALGMYGVPSAQQVQDARFQLQRDELNAAIVVAGKEALKAQTGTQIARQGLQLANLAKRQILDNIAYLADKPLNEEYWQGLSRQIRENAKRYLRSATEIAYLAELAYDFEAERRLNAIKFDYSSDRFGDVLGGDYLLGDLDLIAADAVTTRRHKELPIKYVISLAEKDPIGFAELRSSGTMGLQTSIPEFDFAFPGVYQVRVKSVEVAVQALVGPEGVRGSLTNSGYSLVRLKSPDAPGELARDALEPDWLARVSLIAAHSLGTTATFTTQFPHGFKKGEHVHVTDVAPGGYNGRWVVDDAANPVTFAATISTANLPSATAFGAVTGDSVGDFRISARFQPAETMILSQFAPREDGALLSPPPETLKIFEGLGAGTSWQLELGRASNTFDFKTLVDVRIVLYLTAYYDASLRAAVEDKITQLGEADERFLIRRRTFSLRYAFRDSYYKLLNPQTGDQTLQASFDLRDGMFPYNEVDRKLRHIAVYFAFDRPLNRQAGVPFSLALGPMDPPVSLKATTETSATGLVPADPSAKMFVSGLPGVPDPLAALYDGPVEGLWQLQLDTTTLHDLGLVPESVSDIFLAVEYRYDPA